MKRKYTAVIRRDGKWWIGWIEEVSGVNSQSRSRAGLLSNLKSALREALELNRRDALAATHGAEFEEAVLSV